MTKVKGDVIQAVPLIIGQINVGAGTYTAKGIIHCETDGSITLSDGVTVYAMIAGDDRGYVGKFTVTAGTFTYE